MKNKKGGYFTKYKRLKIIISLYYNCSRNTRTTLVINLLSYLFTKAMVLKREFAFFLRTF